jgi:hypothetical protein
MVIQIAHHPVMGSSAIGSQRKGSPGTSTGDHHHHHHGTGGTPSGLGPRSRSFMNGAGEHTSGDDPISPVVTCIGQVSANLAQVHEVWIGFVPYFNLGFFLWVS